MNHWAALGRLTADPEIKYSEGGVAIAKYTLAVDRIGAKEGQQQADFIPCTSLGKTAERIGNSSLKKGHRMLVTEGQLQSWKSEKDGVTKYGMSVLVNRFQFIEKKGQDDTQKSNIDSVFPDDDLPGGW
jgi:single-strand DNA-binding protein